MSIFLNCVHDTGILIEAQHRIFSAHRLRLGDISPASQKLAMSGNHAQLSGNCLVNIVHDLEIRGKEDIKVALLNL